MTTNTRGALMALIAAGMVGAGIAHTQSGISAQTPPVGHGIGEVVASLLTVSQFQQQYGPGWELADGRDVSGTKYFGVTNRSRLPDMRQRVLRMSLPDELGKQEGNDFVTLSQDQMPRHSHRIPTKVGDSSAQGYAPLTANGNSNNWSWQGAQTGEAGASQPVSTIPAHVTINFFVKVN